MTYASEVLADSPVLFWRLDEASGDFLDSSGNSRPSQGTITNVTRQTAGIADGGTGVTRIGTGQAGGQRNNEAALQVTAMTAEFVIKTTSSGVTQQIGGKWSSSGSQRSFLVSIDTLNRVTVQFRTDTTPSGVTLTDTIMDVNINDGTWHQVAITWEPTSDVLRLYIDGVQRASTTVAGTTMLVGTDPLYIMSRNSISRAVDQMDEFSYYNTALSAARILAHYNAMEPPPTFALLGVATETDTAPAILVRDAVVLGVAVEEDIPSGFQDQTIQLGKALEIDSALAVDTNQKTSRSFGQINLVVYRYTPVSVNVGYEYGSVESFEYHRATANNSQRTTDAGVPTPFNDQRRP